jgi:hypothetical protein
LPTIPARKSFAVNNGHPLHLHGMEEVVGSIPTRSTILVSSFLPFFLSLPLLPQKASLTVRSFSYVSGRSCTLARGITGWNPAWWRPTNTWDRIG